MGKYVTIGYLEEGACADAEQLRTDLVAAGLSNDQAPISQIPRDPRGHLGGVGEIVLTIVVVHAAKTAIGMVFDDLEKALLEFMQERRSKASVRVEVKDGEGEEGSQFVVLRRDLVVEKAVSLAIKTAREIAKSLLK